MCGLLAHSWGVDQKRIEWSSVKDREEGLGRVGGGSVDIREDGRSEEVEGMPALSRLAPVACCMSSPVAPARIAGPGSAVWCAMAPRWTPACSSGYSACPAPSTMLNVEDGWIAMEEVREEPNFRSRSRDASIGRAVDAVDGVEEAEVVAVA